MEKHSISMVLLVNMHLIKDLGAAVNYERTKEAYWICLAF